MTRGGKKKGTLSKTSRILQRAILLATENVGEKLKPRHPDGKLVAYFEHVAETQPVAFTGLLGKMLPSQQEAGDEDHPVPTVQICFESAKPRPDESKWAK